MIDDRKTQLDALAVLLVVGCSALWGVNQVASKVALVEIPPLMQAGLRSLGAAVLLVLWSALRSLPLWARDGTLRGGLLAGSLFAVEFACIFLGLQFTAASRMVVFIYMSPFVVALGMPFITRHERLRPGQLAGLSVAFAGVVWAFAEGFTQPAAGPLQWLGDALGLASAVLWGFTTLSLRATKLSTALPEKTLLWQLGVSGLALSAAAWATGERLVAWPGTLSLVSLGFQTVVVTFASYLVWFWLVRHYPATRLASFTLLTPVFGLLAGVWALGEPATPRLLLALVAVVVGIVLVNRPAKPESPPSTAAKAP